MRVFRFDHRLFQRGLTWPECVSSWEHQRFDFLARIQNVPLLPATVESLEALPKGSRFAIYYSPWSLDSLKTLPLIGKTFDSVNTLEARFFCMDIFFPLLYPTLGRKVPQILQLDLSGTCSNRWGPRPESITEAMGGRPDDSGEAVDQWLWTFDDATYREVLDASIAERF